MTDSIDQDKWKGSTLYAWRWTTGGYNWCKADSESEALAKAGRMGLYVAKGSLKEGASAQKLVDEMDSMYALCD